jgi:hypothetical protein
VLEVFRDVLGVPHLGPDDDFFQHGGHSLSAVRVVTALRSLLDVTGMRVGVLFEHPTPRRLAGHLARVAATTTTPSRQPHR